MILQPGGTVDQVVDEERRLKEFMREFNALKAQYGIDVSAVPIHREIALTVPGEADPRRVWVTDAQLKVSTIRMK